MKLALVLSLLIIAFSCSDKPREQKDRFTIHDSGEGTISYIDTSTVGLSSDGVLMPQDMYDSLLTEIVQLKMAVEDAGNRYVACRKELDSAKNKLFISEYKHERIRYYNNVAKNPGQLKFLRGWINRVYQN